MIELGIECTRKKQNRREALEEGGCSKAVKAMMVLPSWLVAHVPTGMYLLLLFFSFHYI